MNTLQALGVVAVLVVAAVVALLVYRRWGALGITAAVRLLWPAPQPTQPKTALHESGPFDDATRSKVHDDLERRRSHHPPHPPQEH